MFVRRESFQQFIRLYPVVTWLVGINTVIFLLSFIASPLYSMLLDWGIGINYYVAEGQWWRLITPIFFHGGIGHFIFNSFALIIFGPALERIIGRYKFLGVYLFAGFLGNLGTFLFEVPHYVHLGASGAIYGILGVYFYMLLFRKDLIDPSSAQMVLTILFVGAIYTIVMPRINILGHLFGFIGGTVAAPLLFAGRVKYFSTFSDTSPYQHGDQREIAFDPQRWAKQRKRKQIIIKVAWVLLGLFILIGILERFF